MKLLSFLLLLFAFSNCTGKVPLSQEKEAQNVTFNEVWGEVISDPLESLPQNKISFFKLSTLKKNKILENAQRTLDDHNDILKPFNKLAHPNGICFKGVWEIDTENVYGGYFKNKSKALIIARASTAMSNTKSNKTRAFGFAGKLFPTTKPDKMNHEDSANFFLVDDLGGTKASSYAQVELTNEPEVSITPEVIKHMLYTLKVSHTFSKVDSHPTIRQLYEISYLGEGNSTNIITPKWMMIQGQDSQKNADDFRDELKITDGEVLQFSINVASQIIDGKKDWNKIGTIKLDTSVVSNSCDRRLHFHHPKWRDDLKHVLP
ncbi:MAG: hypothetical protein ACI9TV_000838 [Sulfurimonas sp.]|jgi:hypothetical protein|uniref:hypothetical protein n=1 Tax=Sulfurimonas sp. TaxID=2022749 RepID=UPI0039E5599C